MEKTTELIALGIVALVFICFFAVFRSKGKGKIHAPGIDISVEGANQPIAHPSVVVKDATSRTGGFSAEDRTGRGADVQRIAVEGDIRVASGDEASTPPKNRPPI